MNKKGNAVALVLVVMATLASGVLYTQHITNPVELTDRNIAQDAQIMLERAIKLGISDFLLNGFSDQNKVWYCNYPYPPYNEEVNASIHSFVYQRLDSYLEVLRNEGYFVQTPDINFDDEFNENQITVDVTNFLVGVESESLIQKQDVSGTYTYDWPVWLMYSKILQWSEDNSGQITEELFNEAFKGKPCQAISSDCECKPENVTMISEDDKENMKLTLDDALPALNTSLNRLQDEFIGSGVKCQFDIDKYHIENVEKLGFAYSLASYLPDQTDIIDWNENRYEYDYTHYLDDFTIPNPGADELGGCPTFDDNVEATQRENRVEYDSPLSETEFNEFTNDDCADTENDIFKVEQFAYDKRLGMLLTFRCFDQSISIEHEDGIKPLTAEIRLRVSTRLDCPLPDLEPVTNSGEPSYFCGGGGGGGGGQIGAIFCPFPCPECQLCADLDGDGVGDSCLPQPAGSPCGDEVCAVCSSDGQCTEPAPLGIPDQCPEEHGACSVCDGEGIGVDHCTVGSNGLAEQSVMACPNSCYLCDHDGMCNPGKIPEDFNDVHGNICGPCEVCGIDADGMATCVPDPEREGDPVPGQECMICKDGQVTQRPDGEKDREFCSKCESCVQGSCQFDPVHSVPLNKECGSCKQCGELNGEATCVADPGKNGNSCGNRGCSLCNNGECKGSAATVGNICKTSRGCQTRCDINGRCTDGSATYGNSCTSSNSCMPQGQCNQWGSCKTSLPKGKQCCGDQVCNSGDPCCEHGGGYGQWSCGACDDVTT